LSLLDPAHDGTDLATSTGGVRDSDIVVSLHAEVRHALERKAFKWCRLGKATKILFRYRDWHGALPGCKCLQFG